MKQSEALALAIDALETLTERAMKAEGELADALARIDALEKRELVLPEKGEPGEPGLSVDMAEVAAQIDMAVKSAVAALPAPKDGERGDDGIGLADALKDAEGNLVLVMTDGRTKSLGPIDGKDGAPGETFTLDDFDIVPLDDGRSFDFKFTKGEIRHSFELTFPVMLDRGVFKAGQQYEHGDAVSWGGSLWIAQRSTSDKPDGPDSGWRLAVKKGRDGKDPAK